MSKTFCKNCGEFSNIVTAKFCPECGHPFLASKNKPSASPVNQDQEEDEEFDLDSVDTESIVITVSNSNTPIKFADVAGISTNLITEDRNRPFSKKTISAKDVGKILGLGASIKK